MSGTASPLVSIVIPVYNEESILEQAIENLVAAYDENPEFDFDYEILISENGSSDRTVEIGEALSNRFDRVRLLRCPLPDYGEALRLGILEARGELIVCEEIDLCDTDFHRRALAILREDEADMVVGSKALGESQDNRPLFRRVATRVLNKMLWVAVGFEGTDTHGLKSFRRERLLEVVEQCELRKDLFASELVIRAMRGGYRVKEIPLVLQEVRPPSIHLYRRVPKVLSDLGRLIVLIRFKG